MYNLFFIIY